jgi:hypothetical protein
VLAPADVGGDMLFFTPYRIIASNYHREGRGLRDLKAIETAPDAGTARKLLAARQVKAVIFCPGRGDKASWLNKAAESGKYPAWLTLMPGLRFIAARGDKPIVAKVK